MLLENGEAKIKFRKIDFRNRFSRVPIRITTSLSSHSHAVFLIIFAMGDSCFVREIRGGWAKKAHFGIEGDIHTAEKKENKEKATKINK